MNVTLARKLGVSTDVSSKRLQKWDAKMEAVTTRVNSRNKPPEPVRKEVKWNKQRSRPWNLRRKEMAEIIFAYVIAHPKDSKQKISDATGINKSATERILSILRHNFKVIEYSYSTFCYTAVPDAILPDDDSLY